GGASLPPLTRYNFDLPCINAADLAREVRDRNLFHCADVVDAQVFAFFEYRHETINKIVDANEGPRLRPIALNWKWNFVRCLLRKLTHPKRELRNNVLPTHIRAEDVMRAENQDTLEKLSAVVDR